MSESKDLSSLLSAHKLAADALPALTEKLVAEFDGANVQGKVRIHKELRESALMVEQLHQHLGLGKKERQSDNPLLLILPDGMTVGDLRKLSTEAKLGLLLGLLDGDKAAMQRALVEDTDAAPG